MKAVVHYRYGGPEELSVSDLPVPEPKTGEVRVKVAACAVNLSDWEYLTGSPFYARMIGGLWRPKKPVLGSDIVGVVDKLGPGVTGVSTGQRLMGDVVMTRGGFAEYTCVPAAHMVAAPDALSDEVAACLPQAGSIALSGTEGLTHGTKFLINGSGGGSGTMALQLAKAAGARITAVDNTAKVEWLRSLGANAVIDYSKVDFAETGEKWDRILDMVATRGPWRISRALAEDGVYKAVGGRVGILVSLVVGGLPFRLRGKSIGLLLVRESTQRAAQMAIDGIMKPYVEDVLPLSAVPEALRRTGSGEVMGKLVIRP